MKTINYKIEVPVKELKEVEKQVIKLNKATMRKSKTVLTDNQMINILGAIIMVQVFALILAALIALNNLQMIY